MWGLRSRVWYKNPTHKSVFEGRFVLNTGRSVVGSELESLAWEFYTYNCLCLKICIKYRRKITGSELESLVW